MALHASPTPPYPIVIVTGANAGIGFAICQRLLAQLSRPSPPDVAPRGNSPGAVPSCPFAPTKKFTLVLACRNAERANAARQLLLTFIDAEVSRQKKSPYYNGHAEDFRCGLTIGYISLDLTSMESIFKFAEEARRRYPYITHLILNAGILPSNGFDTIPLIKQCLVDPVGFVSTPKYVIQPVGSESQDGLGLVWQSNVFGHYCLARLMEPLLLANPYGDSRVEWMSSIDVEPLDPRDLQLRHTKSPYQVSKYQIDLICTALSRMATKKHPQKDRASISHILVHPGACHTDMATPNTKMTSAVFVFFTVMAKLFFFFWARVWGSRNHPIVPYKGAFAPAYASLAPAAFLQDQSGSTTRKFGTRCTLFGRVSVGVESVHGWEENAEHASDLVMYCEDLFLKFMKARGDTPFGSPNNRCSRDVW